MIKIMRGEVSAIQWDRYVEKFEEHSFNYSSSRLIFDAQLSKFFIEDLSFVYVEQDTPIAIVPLFLEKNNQGENQFSSSLSYQWAPLFPSDWKYKELESLVKTVMLEIDQLAKQYRVQRILYKIDPLTNPHFKCLMYNHNYFMEYDYQDCSLISRVVKLDEPMDQLFKQFRSNHQRCVKKAIKTFTFEVIDADNINEEKFLVFPEIYFQAAGFLTRSMELQAHYYEWIKNGKAIMIYGLLGDQVIAGIMILIQNNRGYYGFGAERPLVEEHVPIGHYLHYVAMKELIKREVQYYELGLQQFGKTHYDEPTKKEMDISYFKSGFGGYNVPFFRAEKRMDISVSSMEEDL